VKFFGEKLFSMWHVGRAVAISVLAYHHVHHGCCHKVAVLCWLDLLLTVVLSSVDNNSVVVVITMPHDGFCSY